MKPWNIVGPLVLVAVSLVPAPAHAQRRSARSGPGGGVRAVPSRSAGPRVVVGAPYRTFSRPYYSFRPRFTVGLGLYAGYPVAFPYYGYAYGNPYAYGYPYPYGYPSYSTYPYPDGYAVSGYPYPDYRPSVYPPSTTTYPNIQAPAPAPPAQGPVTITPGTAERSSGGISFDISPNNAQVYVEGQYVGLVSSFSPTAQPLTLAPGRHHVEIRLVGFQTMTFDAEVPSGQVVPYQGTMQR